MFSPFTDLRSTTTCMAQCAHDSFFSVIDRNVFEMTEKIDFKKLSHFDQNV